jgi:putative transcriptional regulator
VLHRPRADDRTDWARVSRQNDAAIARAAAADPDAALLTPGETRRLRLVRVPDVRALRTGLGLTQTQFARQFGVSPRTVQEWEQGRRSPQGPARVLLFLIAQDPGRVGAMLGQQ